MTRCTCTVFAKTLKLHSRDCAKRQAHEQEQERERTSPPSVERKAGKHARIKEMMKVLRPKETPVFDHQLIGLIGVEKKKK